MDAKTFETAVIKKIAWRILPLILISYCVAYIDRANVAVAALTMNKDLGFSAFTYGLGAGIFFLGYFIFEVPSNLILERVGARRWIARIMFTWGILSASCAFVTGSTSFIIVRFLLGVAEAGFSQALCSISPIGSRIDIEAAPWRCCTSLYPLRMHSQIWCRALFSTG